MTTTNTANTKKLYSIMVEIIIIHINDNEDGDDDDAQN